MIDVPDLRVEEMAPNCQPGQAWGEWPPENLAEEACEATCVVAIDNCTKRQCKMVVQLLLETAIQSIPEDERQTLSYCRNTVFSFPFFF